jgi:hypothetical protein
MVVLCDGLLTEAADDALRCDQGAACQASELRGDRVAYRAAHARVIAAGQSDNHHEYGGEG